MYDNYQRKRKIPMFVNWGNVNGKWGKFFFVQARKEIHFSLIFLALFQNRV